MKVRMSPLVCPPHTPLHCGLHKRQTGGAGVGGKGPEEREEGGEDGGGRREALFGVEVDEGEGELPSRIALVV